MSRPPMTDEQKDAARARLAAARQKRLDNLETKKAQAAAAPVQKSPVTEEMRQGLRRHGLSEVAIDGMSMEVVRHILSTQPVAATSPAPAAPGFELPAAYSKDLSEYRLKSNIEMGDDEWDKKIRSTYNPFEEVAAPYKKANPDFHFAFQSPRVQRVQGNRQMEPVLSKDGKPVEVAGQRLYFEPKRQREAKNKLVLNRASAQAAAPEESYREIQERINHARGDVGVHGLKDNDIVRGHVGKVSTGRYDSDGQPIYEWAEGAAQIGIKTVVGVG